VSFSRIGRRTSPPFDIDEVAGGIVAAGAAVIRMSSAISRPGRTRRRGRLHRPLDTDDAGMLTTQDILTRGADDAGMLTTRPDRRRDVELS